MLKGFLDGSNDKESACKKKKRKESAAMQEAWVIYLKKGMATHSSILAWRIPWTEAPGELQSMGSQRVGHD